MKLLRLLIILLFPFVLAACAADGQGWMDSPLKDTRWKLVTIEATGNNLGREYVGNSIDITMNLKASGDADFKIGCQQATSDWRVQPKMVLTEGEIEFDTLEIAASSCEPNTIANRFIRDFPFFQGYVLIQNHLYLTIQRGEATYGWRRITDQ